MLAHLKSIHLQSLRSQRVAWTQSPFALTVARIAPPALLAVQVVANQGLSGPSRLRGWLARGRASSSARTTAWWEHRKTGCAQPKHFTLGSNLIDKTLCSFYSQFYFTYGPPKKSDGRKWFPSTIFWVIDVVSVCVCFQNSQFWSIWPKTLFLTRTCPSSMIQ